MTNPGGNVAKKSATAKIFLVLRAHTKEMDSRWCSYRGIPEDDYEEVAKKIVAGTVALTREEFERALSILDALYDRVSSRNTPAVEELIDLLNKAEVR